jgi:hypothetical protein
LELQRLSFAPSCLLAVQRPHTGGIAHALRQRACVRAAASSGWRACNPSPACSPPPPDGDGITECAWPVHSIPQRGRGEGGAPGRRTCAFDSLSGCPQWEWEAHSLSGCPSRRCPEQAHQHQRRQLVYIGKARCQRASGAPKQVPSKCQVGAKQVPSRCRAGGAERRGGKQPGRGDAK